MRSVDWDGRLSGTRTRGSPAKVKLAHSRAGAPLRKAASFACCSATVIGRPAASER